MFDVNGVMAAIKAAGIRVIDYAEGDNNEGVDGKVQLNDVTHVQVGSTYLCLVKETRDGRFEWMHEANSLPNMIYFIRSAIIARHI